MKCTSIFSAFLVGASVAVAASAFAPAQAITFGSQNVSPTVGSPPVSTVSTVGITQSDINQSFNVDWILNTNTNNLNLNATSTWKIAAFDNTGITLQINVKNNTQLPSGVTRADLTAFGFGINPDPNPANNGISFTSGGAGTVFNGIDSSTNVNFPSFNTVDIDACLYAGNNCSGGGNEGLDAGGASDIVSIRIAGNYISSGATLAFFPAKFQTSQGSYELAGNAKPVPEPITLLGLGLGTVGLGALKRKYGNKEIKAKAAV